MNSEIGGDPAHELHDAHVLHDDGVSTSSGDGADRLLRGWKLLLENQDVEGHEYADATVMAVCDYVCQFLGGEVGRPSTGVERGETTVHRIRPILYCCTELLVATCRGQDLRT